MSVPTPGTRPASRSCWSLPGPPPLLHEPPATSGAASLTARGCGHSPHDARSCPVLSRACGQSPWAGWARALGVSQSWWDAGRRGRSRRESSRLIAVGGARPPALHPRVLAQSLLGRGQRPSWLPSGLQAGRAAPLAERGHVTETPPPPCSLVGRKRRGWGGVFPRTIDRRPQPQLLTQLEGWEVLRTCAWAMLCPHTSTRVHMPPHTCPHASTHVPGPQLPGWVRGVLVPVERVSSRGLAGQGRRFWVHPPRLREPKRGRGSQTRRRRVSHHGRALRSHARLLGRGRVG